MWTPAIFGLLVAFLPVSMAASIARVLIFTKTLGFRHDSIPTAISTLKGLGPQYNITFDNTEDGSLFTDANLANYDAICFISTTDGGDATNGTNVEILSPEQKQAFQNYLNAGGNFIGVHAASDCMRESEFYGEELGAYFDYHPALQNATIVVIDPNQPSTSMLPARWPVQDEMYNFKSDPRKVGANVTLTVDESTYTDTGTRKFDQGTPHPISWFEEHGAGANTSSTPGRSWYTSLGHLNSTWEDSLYQQHVMGGITWVLAGNTTKAFNSAGKVGNGTATGQSTTTISSPGSAQTPPGTTSKPGGSISIQTSITTTFIASLFTFILSFGLLL